LRGRREFAHGSGLFLLEGFPPRLIAAAFLKIIPDGPQQAGFLSPDEKRLIETRPETESGAKRTEVLRSLADPRVLALGVAYGGILFLTFGFSFWLPLILPTT
jgi:hypothetical protein